MTARDEARVRDRRLAERERAEQIAPEPQPRLGEVLRAARERKGVDLFRAERDTKIRVKYLAALERSDFKELPGAVYTKGFLRNYALYLGLDPDAVIAVWKEEVGPKPLEKVAVVPPRPLVTPRGGFTLSRGLFVAAILTLAVLAFAGYIAVQLFRFAQPPGVQLSQPAGSVAEIDADRTTLSGTTLPGATVTIEGTGRQVYRVTADESGRWRREVELSKGENDFTIVATDPATSKESRPLNVIIRVPIPLATAGPEAPTLEVSSPNEGTRFTNGAIPVKGTTNAARITVTAEYLGPSQKPAGQPSPRPPAVPRAKAITVSREGAFADSYQLAPGEWALTISATNAQEKTTAEKRRVSVAFTGVHLIVDARRSSAWLKVWVDGRVAPGYEAGQILAPGRSIEFSGRSSIEVRTGRPSATYFTLNGAPLGALGPGATPGTWLFRRSGSPQRTDRL